MAPTVTELGDRRHFSLEEQLHRVLRLTTQSDRVRRTASQNSPFRLATFKVMGLVVDQGVREGDSPGLPSSNTIANEDGRQVKQDLIDITLRTMILLRRNQMLQKRLDALQHETRALARSVQNKEIDK